MEGNWYYTVEGKPVGPVSFVQLTVALSGMRDPNSALVWHASLDRWKAAREISEILAIMPDLARQKPPQTELRIEPQRDYVSGRVDQKTEPRKSTWRKTAGTALSVTIFAISYAVVREVTRSSTAPTTDLTAPISGPAKEAFSKAATESCLKKQESDPENQALRLSRETLMSYCTCYVDALASSLTFGDLKNSPKDGSIAPEMQAKINRAGPPCYEDLQRKLMGAGKG